jgi:hypothetical protein
MSEYVAGQGKAALWSGLSGKIGRCFFFPYIDSGHLYPSYVCMTTAYLSESCVLCVLQ